MVDNIKLTPSKRILIVDDNQDAAELLAVLLSSFGYETYAVFNGYDCLDAVIPFKPDIVFLDLGMPGLSGYDVAERLREIPSLKKVCLAAITGWDDELTKERVKSKGFNFHVAKPAELELIMHVIDLSSMSELNWFEPTFRRD